MPVKKDATGRRSVEVELELPGTPEQVWHAIATGPGIASWFVPADVETRPGGAVAYHLGPDMTSTGHVTVWDPPRLFAIEEPGWSGDAPPLATEFRIEARSGGTCTVRLVHNLFTSKGDWDGELESMESGWLPFFRVLAIYLRDFPGSPAASIRPTVPTAGSQQAAWNGLLRALNLSGAAVGEARAIPSGSGPLLAGRVEGMTENPRHCELLMRLEKPAQGVGLLGTYEWGGQVNVAVSLYFYGEAAQAVATREGPIWQAWLRERFGAGGQPTA